MPLISESLRNISAALMVGAILIAALVLGKDVLIPLTLAMVLAFILSPVVGWIAKMRVPRALAVTFVMLLLIAVVAGFTAVVSAQLISLTAGIGSYRANVIEKVRAVTGRSGGQSDLAKAAKEVGSLGAAIRKEIAAEPAVPLEMRPSISTPEVPAGKTIIVTKEDDESDSGYGDYLATAVTPFAKGALTLLLTLFLLLQYQDLRDRVVRVVGTDNMTDTTSAMSEAGDRLSQLFLTQALLNGAFGVVVGLALWAIGIPNAVLWGLVTAVMRFVPYIGSFLAAIPPIILAAAVDPGWGMFFATVAVFGIGEPIMGHVVEPLVLGKRAGISPFAMVASASFWTLLWGPVGLILAAPLTMALIVLGRYIPSLEFFSVLLGDEPALAPHQEFYQRMLSEDSVSAAQQLEVALASAPGAEVTDTLILPALKLAAQDLRRGRLDKEQIAELIKTSSEVRALVYDDEKAKGDRAAVAEFSRTLVIPMRGDIDIVAGQFIGEILVARMGDRLVTVSSSSGLTAIADAKPEAGAQRPEKIVLVSVSGIEQSQLQYIITRAGRDFPGVQLLVLDFRSGDDATDARSALLGDNTTICRSAAALFALTEFKSAKVSPQEFPHIAPELSLAAS